MSDNALLIVVTLGLIAAAFGLNWLHNTIIDRKVARRRDARDSTKP